MGCPRLAFLSSDPDSTPQPPVVLAGAVALCAGLTLVILVGLHQAGGIGALDQRLAAALEARLGESLDQELPELLCWSVAALIAVALPLVLLLCSRGWQRWVLWLSVVVVLAVWAPVLGLAAYRPEMALVLMAAVISGLLSLIQLAWLQRKAPALTSHDHEAS